MTFYKGSPKLASASEIATVQALLQSQGYQTSLHTSSCSTIQYIITSHGSDVLAPSGSVVRPAGLHSCSSASASSGRVVEVVVPVSSRYSQLSMSLMMELMDGVRERLPAVVSSSRAAAAAAAADQAGPASAGQATTGPESCQTDMTQTGIQMGQVRSSSMNSKFSVSLAIVSGAHVVQVQLHDGVQPPSESYG